MDKNHKYAPVLIYLIEKDGLYWTRSGTWCAGQEAWLSPEVRWQSYRDGAEAARQIGGDVIKLRVSAVREPVRRDNRVNLEHVPLEGDIAFSQGWNLRANPHENPSVERVRWIADWWRANSDAFDSHVNGMDEDMKDRGQL